jgi:hypothetical protein
MALWRPRPSATLKLAVCRHGGAGAGYMLQRDRRRPVLHPRPRPVVGWHRARDAADGAIPARPHCVSALSTHRPAARPGDGRLQRRLRQPGRPPHSAGTPRWIPIDHAHMLLGLGRVVRGRALRGGCNHFLDAQPLSARGGPERLCAPRAAAFPLTILRVRVEIMGPGKYENIGKSQPVLGMIDPIIFTRARNIARPLARSLFVHSPVCLSGRGRHRYVAGLPAGGVARCLRRWVWLSTARRSSGCCARTIACWRSGARRWARAFLCSSFCVCLFLLPSSTRPPSYETETCLRDDRFSGGTDTATPGRQGLTTALIARRLQQLRVADQQLVGGGAGEVGEIGEVGEQGAVLGVDISAKSVNSARRVRAAAGGTQQLPNPPTTQHRLRFTCKIALDGLGPAAPHAPALLCTQLPPTV